MEESLLSRLARARGTVPVGIGVASFAAGLGLGYILWHKKTIVLRASVHTVPKVFDDVDPEADGIGDVGDHDKELRPVDLPEELTALGAEVAESIANRTEDETVDTGVVEVVSQSVFAGTDPDWDYEKEVAARNEDEPYALHRDEFFADERNYSQIQLTYYEGDRILVDDDETPIYNHESVVGRMRFGQGSGDPNVFYVRNSKRKAEYEIIRDTGLYSREVLGLEIEDNQRTKDLKHSHQVPKFRED